MNKYFSLLLTANILFASIPIQANEFKNDEQFEMTPGTNYSGMSPEGEKEFWSEDNLRKLDEKIKILQEQNAKRPIPYAGEVILNTPRYTQETNYYCVPACSQILIEYVTGAKKSQNELAGMMKTVEGRGTYMSDAQPVITQLTGVNYELGNNTYSHYYQNMVADINANYPVIYSVDASVFGYGHGNYGHAVLGNGYAPGQTWFWDPFPNFASLWYCPVDEMSRELNNNGGYYIF